MKKAKLRILNVLTSFNTGGAETMLLSLLDRHDREKFDWAVCGLIRSSTKSLLSEFRNKVTCYNLDIPAWSFRKNALRSLISIVKMAYRFREVCKEYKPDVIHAHLFWPSFLTQMLFAFSDMPLLTTYHNTVLGGGKFKHLAWWLSVRIAKPRCVACSQAVQQAIVSSGLVPQRLCVTVPNGVDTEIFNPQRIALPMDNPFDHVKALRVLQVGSLTAKKGYEYTIEALRILKQQGVSALVCCAGVGNLRERLEQRAEQAGVSESIRFLGHRSDVINLLKAADLFIMPSMHEGLSIAMLEAMSMGLAVIVSDVGGAAEVIEDGQNGLLIKPRDPEALARKIMELAGDEPTRHKMGQSARERVLAKFSLRRQALALENLYREQAKVSKTQS